MRVVLKRFWPYIKEYKLYYVLVLFGILLTVSATLATAHIMKPLMDDLFISKKEEMLTYIPLALIAIYAMKEK